MNQKKVNILAIELVICCSEMILPKEVKDLVSELDKAVSKLLKPININGTGVER